MSAAECLSATKSCMCVPFVMAMVHQTCIGINVITHQCLLLLVKCDLLLQRGTGWHLREAKPHLLLSVSGPLTKLLLGYFKSKMAQAIAVV